jgi:hypothetical protein
MSFARVCSGAAPKMSWNLRQSDSLRIPAAMCLTPRAYPGDMGPGGSTSLSTEGGSYLATLRGSPGIVMTSPWGARRNAIRRSSAMKDSWRLIVAWFALRKCAAHPPGFACSSGLRRCAAACPPRCGSPHHQQSGNEGACNAVIRTEMASSPMLHQRM